MKSSATSGATGDEREQTQGAERGASSRDSLVPRRGRLSLLKLLIEQHNIETPPACLPARPPPSGRTNSKGKNYTQRYTTHTE